jgi:hypothetical protein
MNRDSVLQHSDLSSGVASGKSIQNHRAYSWVEMSTPLSSCITPGVFMISVTSCILNLNILTYMLMVCEIMNDFHIRLSIWCLIRNGGCKLILERPHMTYVYICIYVYFERI